MHIKVPFLAVLIISIFQITFYGIEHNNYSKKNFNEIFSMELREITDIEITDLDGKKHILTDKQRIEKIIHYLSQFEYQRLRNDQTSYMPMKTMMITIRSKDDSVFLIPYRKEILFDYKTYRIHGGEIDDEKLLELIKL